MTAGPGASAPGEGHSRIFGFRSGWRLPCPIRGRQSARGRPERPLQTCRLIPRCSHPYILLFREVRMASLLCQRKLAGFEVRHQLASAKLARCCPGTPARNAGSTAPEKGFRRRKFATVSPDGRAAFLSSPALTPPKLSLARSSCSMMTSIVRTGLSTPKYSSSRSQTKCPDCGHPQRQNAAADPPAKSQKNHIIEGRFHGGWFQRGDRSPHRYLRQLQGRIF